MTLLVAATVVAVSVAAAQDVLIDFDDPCALAVLDELARDGTRVRAARFTWVTGRDIPGRFYQEDGMKFLEGVVPPDRALGPVPMPEYHLGYESPLINSNALLMIDLENPENEPRVLAPHFVGATIQMTYDPNNDGIPDPFNLISVEVQSGRLNVGVKTRRGVISVYNDLTAGFNWGLVGANNLIRATLELPLDGVAVHAGGFVVTNIVFQPRTIPPPPPCPRRGAASSLSAENLFDDAFPPFADPPPLGFYFAPFGPVPRVDVKPRDAGNSIDLQNERLLPVAIETTPGFDAANVDPNSLELGPNGARQRQARLADVDGDGDRDLIVLFGLDEIGVACGDTFLSLAGATFRGRTFVGADFIQPTGCEDRLRP